MISLRTTAPLLPRANLFLLRRQLHSTQLSAYAQVQSPAATKGKEKLVILGSGWGAKSLLKELDQNKYDVSVVSSNTYFAMTPLLAQAATGSLEFQAVMEPVRENKNTHFYHAWAESIDIESKKLRLLPAYPPSFHEADRLKEKKSKSEGVVQKKTEVDSGREYELSFDKLVISVGSYNRTFGTPGVVENAWFLKDAQNARSIRYRILECFEQADHPETTDEERRKLLHFIIVGGGPTGSELAAELHDLIKTDLKRMYPNIVDLSKVTIIDASGGILNTFDASLSTYAREKFARDGIELLLNRNVKEVQRGNLIVEQDGEIPFGMLVWSTGNTASPLVESTTCFLKDERNNHFVTDNRLRVLLPNAEAKDDQFEASPDVFALGDCAQIQKQALPATAQVASAKGRHLASVLNDLPGDGALVPETEKTIFTYKNMGAMASLGGGTAIIDGPKAKAQGKVAWVIWRSAYTLMSMSWRNRFLVPGFWMVNRIFGRNLTRF
ncbi:hypothetical protein CBS101457_005632 [Exobasidium rhododendri]|nr:hypothetical protein CBS101457_005632 [Exobasidium rhododendri]